MNDAPLSGALKDALNGLIAERAGDADLVVVTDFGHGLIGPSTVEKLVETAPFLAVNTQTNSANIGFNLITRYPRADYICIDEPEARLAVGDKYSDLTAIASDVLARRVPCPNIIVTHGRKGCVVHGDGVSTRSIPALTQSNSVRQSKLRRLKSLLSGPPTAMPRATLFIAKRPLPRAGLS